MPNQQSPQNDTKSKARSTVLVVLLSLGALGAVCGGVYLATRPADDIATAYGCRSVGGSTASVNGTAVLGKMFEQAGHRVYSRARLTPKLHERADCIVWFPDSFTAPSDKTRQWMGGWLAEESGRTLIYVGRDFDAAAHYWKTIKPTAPKEHRIEIQSRLSEETRELNTRRAAAKPPLQDCDWFSYDNTPKHRKVRTLEDRSDWHEGIDVSKLEIELHGRMKPAPGAWVMLGSEGDMLVSRQPLGNGQLIVVANGSFLLNLPLVNHEHRRLAGKLIGLVGPPEQAVVFLESEWSDPPISSDDFMGGGHGGFAIFGIWPTNWILLQAAVVGILFCFWKLPIFGPRRRPKKKTISDFGRHIDAMGELLELSGDEVFAHTRLQQYRQTTKGKE